MNRTVRGTAAAAALVLGGAGIGAAVAVTSGANAEDAGSSGASSSTDRRHGDETPLTGSTAAKVKAAALAKYPGATINPVETDSDGVYEAHLTTKDGEHLTVEVDKNFAITGTETHTGGHRHADTDSSSGTES